jgi:AraC-like DNA-binding protein
LLRDFAVEQLELENSEKDELEQFVENHYFEDLSLQEISAAFNMSGQYFSKYFKKHVGVQYLKYLTEVRLNHALNDVLYTNKRFLAIAMDNGFPNISAFNHYFKEKYGVSPKSYREKNAFQSQNGHEDSAELAEAIEHLRVRPETCDNAVSLEVDARDKKEYKSFWNKVINFGESRQLDEARILNQLKEVQNQLKFEFIRITLEKHTVNINGDYNLIKEILTVNNSVDKTQLDYNEIAKYRNT